MRRRRRRTRSVHSLCVGCGIEPRNDEIAGAETVFMVERNMCNAAMRGIVVPPGSKATSRAKGSRRNLGCLVAGRRRVGWCWVRRSASGRRGAVADDARPREVGLRHSSCEAGEQSGAIRCGASGAKGGDQGKCEPAKHVPDAEPGKRVTSAGAHTEDRKGKEEGEVHRALPPSQHRSAGGGVLRAQGRRSTRRGSADMDGL